MKQYNAMNKIQSCTVELGSAFDHNSETSIYVNHEFFSNLENSEIIQATPGETISISDFTFDVPSNCTKILKCTLEDKTVLLFFNSSDTLLTNVAYVIRKLSNWVELEINYSESDTQY